MAFDSRRDSCCEPRCEPAAAGAAFEAGTGRRATWALCGRFLDCRTARTPLPAGKPAGWWPRTRSALTIGGWRSSSEAALLVAAEPTSLCRRCPAEAGRLRRTRGRNLGCTRCSKDLPRACACAWGLAVSTRACMPRTAPAPVRPLKWRGRAAERAPAMGRRLRTLRWRVVAGRAVPLRRLAAFRRRILACTAGDSTPPVAPSMEDSVTASSSRSWAIRASACGVAGPCENATPPCGAFGLPSKLRRRAGMAAGAPSGLPCPAELVRPYMVRPRIAAARFRSRSCLALRRRVVAVSKEERASARTFTSLQHSTVSRAPLVTDCSQTALRKAAGTRCSGAGRTQIFSPWWTMTATGYYTVALNIDWPSTHMVAATRTAPPLRERPTTLPGCRRPLSRSLWYLPLRHRQTSRGRSPAQRSRTWCERNAYGAGLAPNSNSHQVRFFGWFDTVSSTTVPAAHIRLLTRTTPCVATKEVHAFTAGAPA